MFKDILKKKKLDEDKENVELEKNDLLALFIAAVSVFLPVLILIFLFIAFLVWLMF